MAIVLAIQKWRHYLLGQKFLVRTDQKSLKFLLEHRLVSVEHQQWLTKLLGYDFDIQYRPRLENTAADALSRLEPSVSLMALAIPRALILDDLPKAVRRDAKLSKILITLQQHPTGHSGYSLVQGNLLYKGRLVLPSGSPFVLQILEECDDGLTGGHSGVVKTYKHVAANVYWVGMKRDIENYVAKYVVCQQDKYAALAPSDLLQTLLIPTKVWDDIAMDFIEGLPTFDGFNSILMVVDRMSKYAHFIGLKHPYSALNVAHAFVTIHCVRS